MTTLQAWLSAQKIVPVVRTANPETALVLVRLLYRCGIRVVELTTTVPGVMGVLNQLLQEHDDLHIGVGTLRNRAMAEEAARGGAHFLVTYHVSEEVAEVGRRRGVPYILGAATPTEVERCVGLASDIVKIFPASVLTPAFVRELSGPLPEVKLFPTGGIGFDQVEDWLAAGALAVGMGSALTAAGSQQAVQERIEQLLTRVGAQVL